MNISRDDTLPSDTNKRPFASALNFSNLEDGFYLNEFQGYYFLHPLQKVCVLFSFIFYYMCIGSRFHRSFTKL